MKKITEEEVDAAKPPKPDHDHPAWHQTRDDAIAMGFIKPAPRRKGKGKRKPACPPSSHRSFKELLALEDAADDAFATAAYDDTPRTDRNGCPVESIEEWRHRMGRPIVPSLERGRHYNDKGVFTETEAEWQRRIDPKRVTPDPLK